MSIDESSAKSKTGQAQDFGAKLKELEGITEWFESEEVDLNAALGKFERGMQLADELQRELDQVENRVEKIKAKFSGKAGKRTAPGDPDSSLGGEGSGGSGVGADPESDTDPQASDQTLFS